MARHRKPFGEPELGEFEPVEELICPKCGCIAKPGRYAPTHNYYCHNCDVWWRDGEIKDDENL